ncbi:hypothetical protein LAU42_09805 [Macrococcus armenti]|uniref:hypothetical protein n=1 Tax=Macrococcus armenti TaxID=2875764 RepID=UPI001CCA726F|nr:hypothetical protein [Macrococcus armenti]UBH08263.1 hypothetical protein LAU41_09760 [Macrococcus armenti]UBH10494.1 hypothetical protein LAU38_09680 [Macrococcus armenti]UBH15042.1 hypothetical protein LAU44_09915 [Macrococcus armenti]UBH17402.1 hypothetical protein LAU39_09940 [Macrococcus armenti]UBH19667.1 hypothetical protein LAU40_09920 [Macrococcus armenti]
MNSVQHILNDDVLLEEEMMQLIHLIQHSRPKVHDIVIGCSRQDAFIHAAYQFKVLWEQYGGPFGDGGHVLDVVDWNSRSKSFNKYIRRIERHAPDAFVALGSTEGFEQVMRRLHRVTEIKAHQTFVMSTLASQTMITSGGMFVFEGMRGITKFGHNFVVTHGVLTVV